jgi:glycosyltransferase involved in cell wall biosynthesis
MESLLIVMPAYNEEENIKTVIEEWHPIVEKIGVNSRLIIVNDGSKDKTYQVANSLIEKYNRLIVLNKENSGHGPTCLYAYKFALAEGADYIFQTDSDGQTLPQDFWKFWESRHHYNLIIGSRNKREDGLSRVFVTKSLKIILFIIFGTYIQDANTPYRLMKRETLEVLIEKIPSDFFLANVLLSVLARKEKEKVHWIPITFRPRQGGTNSINIKRIIKIGFQAVREFKTLSKHGRDSVNGKNNSLAR